MNRSNLLAYLRAWLAHYPEDIFTPLPPVTPETTPADRTLRTLAAVAMARHVLRTIIADVEDGHERLVPPAEFHANMAASRTAFKKRHGMRKDQDAGISLRLLQGWAVNVAGLKRDAVLSMTGVQILGAVAETIPIAGDERTSLVDELRNRLEGACAQQDEDTKLLERWQYATGWASPEAYRKEREAEDARSHTGITTPDALVLAPHIINAWVFAGEPHDVDGRASMLGVDIGQALLDAGYELTAAEATPDNGHDPNHPTCALNRFTGDALVSCSCPLPTLTPSAESAAATAQQCANSVPPFDGLTREQWAERNWERIEYAIANDTHRREAEECAAHWREAGSRLAFRWEDRLARDTGEDDDTPCADSADAADASPEASTPKTPALAQVIAGAERARQRVALWPAWKRDFASPSDTELDANFGEGTAAQVRACVADTDQQDVSITTVEPGDFFAGYTDALETVIAELDSSGFVAPRDIVEQLLVAHAASSSTESKTRTPAPGTGAEMRDTLDELDAEEVE